MSTSVPKKALDYIASIAMLVAAVLLGYAAWSQLRVVDPPPDTPVPSEPVSIDGEQVTGDTHAKVAIIIYSDFQCPFCGTFARSTFRSLKETYVDSGKIRLAFLHLPLESAHPNAFRAAQAAECAGLQGKFWQMHDQLFDNQTRLQNDNLSKHAAAVGLDAEAFAQCMEDGRTGPAVRRDVTQADLIGIKSTPTIFFGRIQQDGRIKVLDVISGARPLAEFARRIEKALKTSD